MLGKLLAPHSGKAFAALRIVSALMFALFGAQKVFGLLSANPPAPMFSLFWVGGVIEIVGGLLIAFGLFTVIAAFICCGQMAVAYTMFHWNFAFDSKFFPTVNHGELALLYCFLFLFIACHGAGPYSIDARRR